MDVDKIFNSFNDEEYQEKIKELRDTPQYWIGMFKKLIYNYNNGYSIFMSNLLSSMEDTDDIDKEKVKQSVEYLTYNIAYSYIVKLDITDLSHLYYIILESDDTLLTSLNLCLKYFEDRELYEYCTVLKSIETEVKKSILKFGSPNK
jgi:hypothetical protein